MCGIAGFCNFKIDYTQKTEVWKTILIKMRESIAHRGKDNVGEYLEKNVGLSHTRLSIRDLSFGAQPMFRTINGHRYVIVYNGEVYNTDELIPTLKKAGYQFETTTDTEVILYAYIHYGREFVSKLNGIFAFAIWDGNLNELFLYRDRVGVKPLFYSINNNSLVFGSEMKALFCHPQIKPKINLDSFREIFGVGPARTPGNGVFHGIKEVKPGHYVVFSENAFQEICYWKLEATEHKDSYEQTKETLSYLVHDAITRQMVSDVPICSFLSGGLDSSIVTAIASRFLSEKGLTLNTFSFDFSGNDTYFQPNSFQPEQDRPYVDEMLKAYDLHHTYLECDESCLVDMLSAAVYAKDLPGMTDIDASLLYFCSLVKQHNKVVLTGECADEIFGGYPWFYKEELKSIQGFPWSHDFQTRSMLLRQDFAQKLDIESYSMSKYENSLKELSIPDGKTTEFNKEKQISFLNIKWFMQTLLDRMDRTSMYSGLEARVPFADHRIIEYMFQVPWEMKYKNQVEKSLLRESCQGLLPEKLLYRKKSPYPKTYHPNYEKLLASKLTKIMENSNSPLLELIDVNKTKEFIKSPKIYGKPWFGQLMAGPQLIAYLIQVNDWLERYDGAF